ncbi:sulfotransferase [Ascidiaceihabitans sp.]|uniref:sulfotransferase n=1 Tax=Ascidiaceihabitans sp. TaxID=1872644 RepID=UPI003297384A
MTDKTVVIGIGAQKGGTSWLHYFLKHHPQCAMSSIKELHYFDCVEMKRQAFMADIVKTRRAAIFGDPDRTAEIVAPMSYEAAQERFEKWSDLMTHETIDKDAYLNYLLLGSDDASVVGEVTPAYAMLSADSLREMHSVAANTKLIFLMRDPVSRLWSNLRMRAKKRTQTPEDMLAHAFADFAKIQAGGIKGVAWRSDYRTTLDNLKATLPAQDVHVDFFETLFDDGASRICKFLGIDNIEAPVETNVNEGIKIDLPQDLAHQMFVWLKPQYTYVREMFGQLPAKWTQSMEAYA